MHLNSEKTVSFLQSKTRKARVDTQEDVQEQQKNECACVVRCVGGQEMGGAVSP